MVLHDSDNPAIVIRDAPTDATDSCFASCLLPSWPPCYLQ